VLDTRARFTRGLDTSAMFGRLHVEKHHRLNNSPSFEAVDEDAPSGRVRLALRKCEVAEFAEPLRASRESRRPGFLVVASLSQCMMTGCRSFGKSSLRTGWSRLEISATPASVLQTPRRSSSNSPDGFICELGLSWMRCDEADSSSPNGIDGHTRDCSHSGSAPHLTDLSPGLGRSRQRASIRLW
jgi:hypothetical protein